MCGNGTHFSVDTLRLFETLISERLDVRYVTFQIVPNIHGFREKRSCETQLVMLVDEISKSMQMGKQTDLILLDFSKAFDKVAHKKRISKLQS